MKTRNDKILDWAIKKVRHEYRHDVCLLVIYGSYINGTADAMSDIDFYFVPENEKARSLAMTFIVEGVGYDLFPVSWERVEGMATLNESLIPLLGDSKIVYAGSGEYRKRFEKLQATLQNNLNDYTFMHRKAIEKLSRANETMNKLTLESQPGNCRLLAGTLLMQLAEVVAYENQTYFTKGLKTQFADLKTMGKLPDSFIDGYEAVIMVGDIAQLKLRCEKLMESCKAFLNARSKINIVPAKTNRKIQTPQTVDFPQLADLYGEIISTFNKVYSCCKSSNVILAFISAVCLQQTLNEDVPGIHFDLLSDYDSADLGKLAASVKTAETELVNYITSGAIIKRYATVDEFIDNKKQFFKG